MQFSLIILILVFIPAFQACSKPPLQEHSTIYNFLNHTQDAQIESEPLIIPDYKYVVLKKAGNTWTPFKNEQKILPVAQNNESHSFKNGGLEISFKFTDNPPLKTQMPDSVNFKNEKITSFDLNQWETVDGNWIFSSNDISNTRVKKKYKFRRGLNYGDPKLIIPLYLSRVLTQVSTFKNAQASVDLLFKTRPLRHPLLINNLNKNFLTHKVYGLSGILFQSNSVNPLNQSQNNGIAILTNEKADLIFGELLNNSLLNPNLNRIVIGDPAASRLFFKDNANSPENITFRLSATLSGRKLIASLNNGFHETSFDIPSNFWNRTFNTVGILNGVREDTRFSRFSFETIPSEKNKIMEGGIFFNKSTQFPGYFVTLSNRGILSFGILGKKPEYSKQVLQNGKGPDHILKVAFSEKNYQIYLNNYLEIEGLIDSKDIIQSIGTYVKGEGKQGNLLQNNAVLLKKGNPFLKKRGTGWGLVKNNSLKFNKIKYWSDSGANPFSLKYYKEFSFVKNSLNYKELKPKNNNPVYLLHSLKLDQSSQKALIVRPSSKITYKVKIPENAVLTFGTGVLPQFFLPEDKTEFSISLIHGNESKNIFSENMNWNTNPGWHHHKVDLKNLSGKEVKLQFKVKGKLNHLAFWGDPQITTSRKPGEFNIILISIDTLRADHLSSYGYPLKTSPNLDKIAKEGVLFKNTISQAPWTYPSHASLFTSLYPSALGYQITKEIHLSQSSKIPFKAIMLAEILKYNGYKTGAFVGGGPISSEYGFSRGFSIYNEKWEYDIETSSHEAINWINQNKNEKFFLFFHTFEVHDYPDGDHEIFSHTIQLDDGLKRTLALYDGKIKLVDDYIGLIANKLKSLNLHKNTLMVITSDHGKEFYDHGNDGHGYSLYDEQLRVPLIFWSPGILPENKIILDQVRLIDILPTLLDLTGIKTSNHFEGKSLKSLINGKNEERMAFSEGTKTASYFPRLNPTSLRTNRYKFIEYPKLDKDFIRAVGNRYYQKKKESELFDLKNNPEENIDKQIINKPLKKEFSERIKIFKRNNARKWDSLKSNKDDNELELQKNTLKRLQSLGYLQ